MGYDSAGNCCSLRGRLSFSPFIIRLQTVHGPRMDNRQRSKINFFGVGCAEILNPFFD